MNCKKLVSLLSLLLLSASLTNANLNVRPFELDFNEGFNARKFTFPNDIDIDYIIYHNIKDIPIEIVKSNDNSSTLYFLGHSDFIKSLVFVLTDDNILVIHEKSICPPLNGPVPDHFIPILNQGGMFAKSFSFRSPRTVSANHLLCANGKSYSPPPEILIELDKDSPYWQATEFPNLPSSESLFESARYAHLIVDFNSDLLHRPSTPPSQPNHQEL